MSSINNAGCQRLGAALVTALLVGSAGCGPVDPPASVSPPHSQLRIGFGLTSGENPRAGIRQAIGNIAFEALVWFSPDAQPQPWLADKWSYSDDGLVLRVHLRPGVTFHDGSPVSAEAIREILLAELPDYIGPAFEDIRAIRAVTDLDLEFELERRSNFVLEGLDAPIRRPGTLPIGTGPFRLTEMTNNQVTMEVNDRYYGGKPPISEIVISPYTSVRSAWADLLRNDVDMLYEVGSDALDFLQPSAETDVFSFRRAYSYVVLLNLRKPHLRDKAFRRALNAAVDREAIVSLALKGYGNPADGALWPLHWAFDPTIKRFGFEPQRIPSGTPRIRVTCLVDRSLERLGLLVQRQLRAVGVDLVLQEVSMDEALARLPSGDFEAVLADARQGPAMVKQYVFWHSTSPLNWGGYSSAGVDEALDAIRGAANAESYKAGVSAFERAIVDDPPAIFLAWTQRARAVSKRFDVPVQSGRDILRTLSEWRPIGVEQVAKAN